MTEISNNIEEELNKKSEEILFLNEKLQSLKSNLFESSKHLDNLPILKPRHNLLEISRIKHYSLDPEFLKNNGFPRPEPITKQEPLEKEENEKNLMNINKILTENSNKQAEQLKKLTQKLDFLSTEFEKSLKEKTQILQDQMKLLKDNSNFIKENQFLHNQNKKLLLDIETFNVAQQKEKKDRESLLKDFSIKAQEIEALKKEMSVLLEKNSKITQNYEKLKAENEGIMTNKLQMIESMTIEINKNTGEINDSRQKYINLLDNKKMIEQDNDYLRDKCEEQEDQLKGFQEKFVFDMEKKDIAMADLMKDLENKDLQIKEFENLINNLKKDLSLKDFKYNELDNRFKALNKEYDVLGSENRTIRRQCDNFQRENKRFVQNQEEFDSKIADYEIHKEELMYSYTLQRNKILGEYRELSAKCEELEAELKSFKNDPNGLKDIDMRINEMHNIHNEIDEKIKEEKRGECVIQ